MTLGAPLWLGKLAASVGSGPTLVGLAVGGIVVGTVGSLTLGGRAAVLQATPQPLPLFACPDGQTVVGQVEPGAQVLVTARSADGSWLEVHFPDGRQDRAWGERAAFTLDADAGGLPVSGCGPGASPPPAPAASLTIVAAYSPSPPPTRGPTPTPRPDTGCSGEASLRSLEGRVNATLVVTNNTAQTLQLLWLDYTGARVFYKGLPPSTTVEQPTWLTHPWVIASR